jgi:hypothetical protein
VVCSCVGRVSGLAAAEAPRYPREYKNKTGIETLSSGGRSRMINSRAGDWKPNPGKVISGRATFFQYVMVLFRLFFIWTSISGLSASPALYSGCGAVCVQSAVL